MLTSLISGFLSISATSAQAIGAGGIFMIIVQVPIYIILMRCWSLYYHGSFASNQMLATSSFGLLFLAAMKALPSIVQSTVCRSLHVSLPKTTSRLAPSHWVLQLAMHRHTTKALLSMRTTSTSQLSRSWCRQLPQSWIPLMYLIWRRYQTSTLFNLLQYQMLQSLGLPM